jgi:hypothetical protein
LDKLLVGGGFRGPESFRFIIPRLPVICSADTVRLIRECGSSAVCRCCKAFYFSHYVDYRRKRLAAGIASEIGHTSERDFYDDCAHWGYSRD